MTHTEEEIKMAVTCPNCGGTGSVDYMETYPECCGHVTKTGDCCNNQIPVEINIRQCCPACEGTGILT